MNGTTVAFIVTMVALIAIFDVLQLVRKGSQATISHVLYTAAQRWPIIPFTLGVVVGHLFWLNG